MIISDDESELSPGETLSLDEIMTVARDIQNRSGRRIGSKVVEDRNFREHFGTSQEVVLILWNFLNEHDLLPEKCDIKHLLWALFFLKVYPKQGPACSVVGGSNGAVDPKTLRKWVWSVIFSIAELAEVVVSSLSDLQLPTHTTLSHTTATCRYHCYCIL